MQISKFNNNLPITYVTTRTSTLKYDLTFIKDYNKLFGFP